MQSTPTTNGAISSAFAFYMYTLHMLIRKLHMFMSISTYMNIEHVLVLGLHF